MNTLTQEQSRGVRRTVLVLLAIMLFLLGMFLFRQFYNVPASAEALQALGAQEFSQPRRFEAIPLLDQNGEAFDFERFKAGWSLVFFGFTHCPDICPTTMALLKNMYEGLDAQLQTDTQVVLSTADPGRDTPGKLKEYVAYFSPEFIGLTGEFLAVHKFARQLNAPFRKVPGAGEDYEVEHSGQIMIINPRGDYHGYLRPPFTAESIERAYLALRKNYELRFDG